MTADPACVFISYRSADGKLTAGFVFDWLAARLGADRVFRDHDSLQCGEFYPSALRESLDRAAVVLAVIGPHWLGRGPAGRREIDRPGDWVRYEVSRALVRGVKILPVLVDGAQLPTDEQVPADIRRLASIQAFTLSDRAVHAGMRDLVDRLVRLEPALNAPSSELLSLLRAQRAAAERLPYRLLSGPQPPLSEVYVEQRVHRPAEHPPARPAAKKHSGADDARAAERAAAVRSGGAELESRPVAEVLRERRHALLIGEPGVGKSTLLSQLVRASAEWWQSWTSSATDLDPFGGVVVVRLAATALTGKPLADALTEAVSAELGARLDRSLRPGLFAAPPMVGMDWLILVDGLDEVLDPAARAATIAVLAERLARPGGTGGSYRFLIASRPLPDWELAPIRLPGVGDWRLRPFDEAELDRFARRWFRVRGGPDAERAADDFLAHVERTGLRPVIQVPLLATIAAVMYERHCGHPPRVAQTALFEQFVRYLLQVREESMQGRPHLRAQLGRYAATGAELADWLYDHRLELLEYLATEFLAGRSVELPELTAGWVAQRCPAFARLVPDWESRLLELLRDTGLLLERDGGLAFLHQSLAEYLAAGPAAARLEPATWRGSLLDPGTRNQALLTAGRWAQASGNDATTLVEPLLRSGNDDAVLAVAAVAAHRIPVAASTHSRLVDALLRRARTANQAVDCCAALSLLPGRDAVIAGLARLMVDADVQARCRVEAARTHGGLAEPGPALSAVTGLAEDAGAAAADRILAARALADLGDRGRGIQILNEVANQPTVVADQRLRAAEHLADLGAQAAAVEVLTGMVADDRVGVRDRVTAARWLGRHGESEVAISTLITVVGDRQLDIVARIWAAGHLGDLGQPELGLTGLRTIVADPRLRAYDRALAAERIAKSGHRTEAVEGLTVLLGDPTVGGFDRMLIARRLAALDEADLARGVLLRAAHDRRAGSVVRREAARTFAAIGDREVAQAALRRLGRRYRSGQNQLDAACALGELGSEVAARAILTRLVRAPHRSPSTRVYAALALVRLGDSDRARRMLRRLAGRWWLGAYARSLAAGHLADLGDRGYAVRVLDRLLHRRFVTHSTRAAAAGSLAALGKREKAVAALTAISDSRGRLGLGTAVAGRYLAEMGERGLAIDVLTAMAYGWGRSDGRRLYAAQELAFLGEHPRAVIATAAVLRDLACSPDNLRTAAHQLCQLGQRTTAATLLTGIGTDRRGSISRRLAAIRALASAAGPEPTRKVLRSVVADFTERPAMRVAAAAELVRWRVGSSPRRW